MERPVGDSASWSRRNQAGSLSDPRWPDVLRLGASAAEGKLSQNSIVNRRYGKIEGARQATGVSVR